jgi:Tfp pilus assembly protein PilF
VADEGDARRLLERAREARRQRRPRDAERSYEQVLADFPQSRFASLAAFELGRLRMDALDDLAGAVRALERSLRSPGQDHREDALGRLVQLTRELGRKSECEVWRARYLKQFPEGAHLTSMERGCER